jgi:uncharacterized DUF497 family protein
MEISVSPHIQNKLLEKHNVQPEEVEQCFYNRRGGLLEDTREEHKTTPPSQWFIAETDKRRKLKVIFVLDGDIRVKSAYDADEESIRIYKKYAF